MLLGKQRKARIIKVSVMNGLKIPDRIGTQIGSAPRSDRRARPQMESARDNRRHYKIKLRKLVHKLRGKKHLPVYFLGHRKPAHRLLKSTFVQRFSQTPAVH